MPKIKLGAYGVSPQSPLQMLLLRGKPAQPPSQQEELLQGNYGKYYQISVFILLNELF